MKVQMQHKRKLSVSMMCADLLNLQHDIRRLEKANVDYLHIDMMDGQFVPNLTFGIDALLAMRRATKLPMDIHLLMNHPHTIIRSIDIQPGEIVSIHAECKDKIIEHAGYVKLKGGLFGLVLNPTTKIEEVQKYLPYIDVITLMLIVPGFAGSTMLHGIMEKVAYTRAFLDKRNYEHIQISVDGSVSKERAQYMAGLGANIFVGGTAGVFIKGRQIEETIPEFYQALEI